MLNPDFSNSVGEIESSPPPERNVAVTADLQDLHKKINSMVEVSENIVDSRSRRRGICKVCGKEGKLGHLRDHIEAHHITGFSHTCEICGAIKKTMNSLRVHKSCIHKTGRFPTKKSKKNGGKIARTNKREKSDSTMANVVPDKDGEKEYTTKGAEVVSGEANLEEDNKTEEKDKPKTSCHQEDLIPKDEIKAEPSQDETASNTEEIQVKRLFEFSAEKEAEYPSVSDGAEIKSGPMLELESKNQLKIWFQNKRRKLKKSTGDKG